MNYFLGFFPQLCLSQHPNQPASPGGFVASHFGMIAGKLEVDGCYGGSACVSIKKDAWASELWRLQRVASFDPNFFLTVLLQVT